MEQNNNMIFLSDRFMEKQDEGLVKYTTRIAELLKQEGVTICGFGTADGAVQDFHIPHLIAPSALRQLARRPESHILFAPRHRDFSALVFMTVTHRAKKDIRLLIANQQEKSGKLFFLTRWIFSLVKPEIWVSSIKTRDFFRQWYKGKICYFQAAVDTGKFRPVTPVKKQALRKLYGLPQNMPLLFHAGHITLGRRLDWMLEIPDNAAGVLAVSGFWKPEEPIYHKLLEKTNILILSDYYPRIQELYQACDVCVFTPRPDGAMNVPLSVFEAMACNLPVVSTRHGELEAIDEGDGLCYISGEDPKQAVQEALKLVQNADSCHTREKVLCYDWKAAVHTLTRW